MCGVLGYYSSYPRSNHYALLCDLMTENKIRGLHAFGITYVSEGRMVTVKSLELQPVLDALMSLDGVSMLIGHNRYSTSGDWQDIDNNQPIDLGFMSLVFNGVISMKTKEEFEEEYGFTCVTYNDGEILMRHIEQGGDAADFVSSMKGSFAGCYIADGQLYMPRNSRRPLWYTIMQGAVFVASTKDIFSRVLGSSVELMEFPANVIYTPQQLFAEVPKTSGKEQVTGLSSIPQHYSESARYGSRLSH